MVGGDVRIEKNLCLGYRKNLVISNTVMTWRLV